jgi:hypothetical protein
VVPASVVLLPCFALSCFGEEAVVQAVSDRMMTDSVKIVSAPNNLSFMFLLQAVKVAAKESIAGFGRLLSEADEDYSFK